MRSRQLPLNRTTAFGRDADALIRQEPAPAIDALNTRLLQKAEMQMIEPIHLGPHPAKQFRNAALNGTQGEAIGRCIVELMPRLSAVDQKLFGDTSPDHTGAADAVSLNNGHLGAMAGRPLGSGQPSRPCTQNNQIKGRLDGHGDVGNRSILMTRRMPVDVPPDTWQKVKAALWSEQDWLKDT